MGRAAITDNPTGSIGGNRLPSTVATGASDDFTLITSARQLTGGPGIFKESPRGGAL
jgi:hypothetical protein